jgi:hypothetical protein
MRCLTTLAAKESTCPGESMENSGTLRINSWLLSIAIRAVSQQKKGDFLQS